MKKLCTTITLLLISSKIYSAEIDKKRIFFDSAKMHISKEIEPEHQYEMLKEILKAEDIKLGCSGLPFEKIIYDHCAYLPMLVRDQNDTVRDIVIGGMIATVADHYTNAMLDRVDHTAANVYHEVSARRERERKEAERAQRDAERARRDAETIKPCNTAIRAGECKK